MADASKPWLAQREVSPSEALGLISAQFPELADSTIELYGVGWDNTVFLIAGAYVFRFPRRELAVRLIEIESRVLPELAGALPLAIPAPRFVGAPSEAFPWPFHGYAQLPGTTADRARLDARERERAAAPIAAFLRALHTHAPPAQAPPDGIRRLDLPYRTPQIETRLAEACEHGLVRDRAPFEALLADVPSGWTPTAAQLVHGDLYARHVLVNEDRQPCGVIDWGDVHRGDPAVDLGLAHGFLPARARSAFREAYGEISEDTWRVARFKALHHALSIVVYGHDVGDAPLLAEGRVALENLVDD